MIGTRDRKFDCTLTVKPCGTVAPSLSESFYHINWEKAI